MQFCDANDTPLADYITQSACDCGMAYANSLNSPFAVNDTLAYGFAAVALTGETEAEYCCQCYQLTFTSTTVGKTMIVQVIDTGCFFPFPSFSYIRALSLESIGSIPSIFPAHHCGPLIER